MLLLVYKSWLISDQQGKGSQAQICNVSSTLTRNLYMCTWKIAYPLAAGHTARNWDLCWHVWGQALGIDKLNLDVFFRGVGRIEIFGNPSMYDTFMDEHLNIALRDCAAFAHRRTMHKRIFVMLSCQGKLVHGSFLFGSNDPDE